MASLQVPERSRKTLRLLAALGQKSFDELMKALGSAPLAVWGDDFANRICADLKTLSPANAKILFRTLIGLSLAKAANNKTTDDVVSDILNALREATSSEDEFTSGQLEKLRSRLVAFMGTPSLDISVKAMSVLSEHQRVLVSSRVLSDIRPVFRDAVDSGPVAAVLVHTLKLEYHESGEINEFFLAMDSKDLDVLIKVLERAKAKESAIQLVLSNASLPRLIDES